MSQIINFVPLGFCRITMVGAGFMAASRAKDAMVLPLADGGNGQSQQLRFYDCSCGHIRQLPGRVVEREADRMVFEVGPGKKFILEKLSRP